MMRFIPKKFWFCIIVGMLMFQCVAWGGWSWAPAIEVNYLWKEYDQLYFHISQSCGLAISAEDYDSYNDVPQPHNWISYALSYWWGDFVTSRYGRTNSWQCTHSLDYQDEVFVMIRDDPDCPNGSSTDDSSVISPSAYFQAWEVAGTLEVDGATKTIHESDYLYPSSDSLSGNLNGGAVTADTSPNGIDDGPRGLTVQVDASFDIHKRPSGAFTDEAVGSADVSTSMSGTINGSTDDDDMDIYGGSMSVGVTVPGTSVGISLTPDFNGENCEAVAGIGFGFASNVLGSAGANDAYTVAKSSGDLVNDGSCNFSHSNSDSFAGHLGGETERAGQILIKGYVEALGQTVFVPEAGWITQNSDSSVSSSGSYSFSMGSLSASTLYWATYSDYIYP